MAVTSYYSVNGILLGEKSTGGSRVDYLSDALGSVTATVNASAQVVNTYRYKPYGSQLAKTGVGSDPAFTWVGQWGYRQTGRRFSDVYIRARHYSSITAGWTSKVRIDEFRAGEHPYGYAVNRPTVQLDPSGHKPCDECCCTINSASLTWKVMPYSYSRLGHIVTTTVSMSNRKMGIGDVAGTCTLTWLEKTNSPNVPNVPIDKWYDVCIPKDPDGNQYLDCPNTTFDPKVPKKCPEGPNNWVDRDEPSLAKLGRSMDRMLCIKVILTDGCTGRVTELRFNQFLDVENDRYKTVIPPGQSAALQRYCWT